MPRTGKPLGRPPGSGPHLVRIRFRGGGAPLLFIPRYFYAALGSPQSVSLRRVSPTEVAVFAGAEYAIITSKNGSPRIAIGAPYVHWLKLAEGFYPARMDHDRLLLVTPEVQMAFTVFHGRYARRNDPIVRIGKDTFMLTRGTFSLLKEPTYIQLLWDADNRYIGFRRCEKGDEGAFRCSSNTPNNAFWVSGKSFYATYAIDSVALKGSYEAKQEGDIVYIELPPA